MAKANRKSLMLPVEKMATRILERNGLQPPYDLEKLVNKYADLEYRLFPTNADGITIGIGSTKRPQILINSAIPDTRKRFTLAHELGHIIIPWHTGTLFVSHIEYDKNSQQEYKAMEDEAHKFAAELLLPTKWLRHLYEGYSKFSEYMEKVLSDSGASRDATLIKVSNALSAPIFCVEVSEEGTLIRQFNTSCGPRNVDLHGKNLLEDGIFETATSDEIFNLGDKIFRCWKFEEINFEDTDTRTWREVLNEILQDTNTSDLRQSINAVLPNKFNNIKHKSVQEICCLILNAYDGREKFRQIILHPLFPQYIIKRVKELKIRCE